MPSTSISEEWEVFIQDIAFKEVVQNNAWCMDVSILLNMKVNLSSLSDTHPTLLTPPFHKFQFKEFPVECRVGARQDPLSHYGNLLGQTLSLSALYTHLPSVSQGQVHDKLGWPAPPLDR